MKCLKVPEPKKLKISDFSYYITRNFAINTRSATGVIDTMEAESKAHLAMMSLGWGHITTNQFALRNTGCEDGRWAKLTISPIDTTILISEEQEVKSISYDSMTKAHMRIPHRKKNPQS